MAERVLMAVHGMGVHEPGWEQEVRAKLEEVAGRYRAFRDDPTALWQELRLVPVGYDDLLRDTLAEWRTTAGGVLEFVRATELVGAPDLSWLQALADEDPGFFWTHASDVVIYRFFRLQRAAIQASVAKQILDAVPQAPARDFDRCVVMAHSLGTAVAHDALHLLATRPLAGMPSAFGALDARFAGIWMLANTSRLLQTDDAKAYESVVHGGPRSSPSTNCGLFRSVSHELDPICIPRRFDPVGWSVRYNQILALDHLRDWNVHGWTHYLDNPRVHVPLLNLALGRNAVAPSEAVKAVDAYERFGGRLKALADVQAVLREAKAELARLHENAELRTYFEVAQSLKDQWERLKPIVQGLADELRQDLEGGV